jgi:phosphoribosylanthranilate isomerase
MRQEPFPLIRVIYDNLEGQVTGFLFTGFRYAHSMTLLNRFLDPDSVSLKICGVTTANDAEKLTSMGVDAIGLNFWKPSKRYLDPTRAEWLHHLAGRILRVGVFVNEPTALPLQLIRDGYLDAIQLHGDESPSDAQAYRDAAIPFIKAIGVKTRADLDRATQYGASGILLDAHAPGVYGGTGEPFDWEVAVDFRLGHPLVPVILAGGIVPENTTSAVRRVKPAAIDIASGAETSPGIKDFKKVAAFLTALNRPASCL